MPVDASDAMLLADCGVSVASALGATAAVDAERSSGATMTRRRCFCDISELSMQNPAGCVLERMKLAPGRQYDRMKN
eukprot:14268718-Heterocapsa_arctica.AAC.1